MHRDGNLFIHSNFKGGPTTKIYEPNTDKNKTFTFDYSFWSHDGFEDQDGLLVKTGPQYADQKDIFNTLGKMVLDNAWEGYHCCLFAYGQTGSGKSYSMVGYGKNKGIVPISMNEIFERVAQQKSETKSFEVSASIIEIYNEKIQDLLIDPRTRPAGGLKVRESKTLGVYV